MIIKSGEKRSETYKGQTIDGLNMFLYLYAAANNTAINISDVDFSKIIVEVALTRNGKEHMIMNAGMDKLFRAANFHNTNYELMAVQASQMELRALATAVKAIELIPIQLNLGEVINLRSNDELRVDVNMLTPFTADIDTSTSYIKFDTNQVIGVEDALPEFQVYSISASDSEAKISAGNDVVGIFFINTDKTDILAASTPITSVNLRSKQLNLNDDYYSLLCKRSEEFQLNSTAAYRYQSFCLYKGEPIDGVTVDLTLVSANVNSGKCAVVVIRSLTNSAIKQMADATRMQHFIEHSQKVGISLDPKTVNYHKNLQLTKSQLLSRR